MVSVHRDSRDVLIGGELLERHVAPSPTHLPPQRHIPPPRAILLSPLSQFAAPSFPPKRHLDDGSMTASSRINSAPTMSLKRALSNIVDHDFTRYFATNIFLNHSRNNLISGFWKGETKKFLHVSHFYFYLYCYKKYIYIIGETFQFSLTSSWFILEMRNKNTLDFCKIPSSSSPSLGEKLWPNISFSRGGRVNRKKVSRTRQHSAFLPFPEERLKKKKKKRRKEGKKFALNKQKPSFTSAEPFSYLLCGNLMIKMTLWEGGDGRTEGKRERKKFVEYKMYHQRD